MDRPKGIFITGTDTGVGKTVCAATIASLLRMTGVNVGVMKPVTSGCIVTESGRRSEDADLLIWASGCESPYNEVAPYLLELPVAPSIAAEREGVRIDFGVIREKFLQLSARHDFVIVEGAGGLMVPLAGGLLVADLVKQLDMPILVVARAGLGTVNHTLLTCFCARQMEIDIRGIVIGNYPQSPGDAESYARHMLSSLSGYPVLGVFPHVADPDPKVQVKHAADAVSRAPETRILFREIGLV